MSGRIRDLSSDQNFILRDTGILRTSSCRMLTRLTPLAVHYLQSSRGLRAGLGRLLFASGKVREQHVGAFGHVLPAKLIVPYCMDHKNTTI